MKLIQYFYLFTLFLIGLFACNSNSNQQSNKIQKEVIETETTPVDKVPIYTYDQMKHLFNKQNDTCYIINFWATWCKPCVEELPYFEEAHQVYKDQKVKFILVSLDFEKQIEKKLIPFLVKNKLQSEVVVLTDPDRNIDNIDTRWSGSIPATLIYNKDKRDFHETAFENFEELNEIIKSFLQ